MRDQSLSISMFESTDEALVEVFDALLLVFSYKLFNHGDGVSDIDPKLEWILFTFRRV